MRTFLLLIFCSCVCVVLMAGCGRTVRPIKPAVYRQRRSALIARWKAGDVTTSFARRRLQELDDGLQCYRDDHHCGDGQGSPDAGWTN